MKLADRIAALRARLEELQRRTQERPILIDLTALGIPPPASDTSTGLHAPEEARPRSRENPHDLRGSATYGRDSTVSRP
jgi:hypothetical protein